MQLLDNIVAPWAPPQRTSGAMDQQRRESIQRMGIPSSCTPAYYSNPPSSSSTPRQHSPFPGGTQSGRRNMSQPLVSDYTILIYPYSLVPDDRDTFESHPGAPLLAIQKVKMLMNRLREFGLCFDVQLTGSPRELVYPQLLTQVSTETRHNGISWAPHPGTFAEEESDYESGPFLILIPGKVSYDKMSHRLGPLNSPTYGITNATLKSSMKRFRHPLTESKSLIAICPRWGKLRKIDLATNIWHTCIPRRVMNGFHSTDINEDQLPLIECFPDCAVIHTAPADQSPSSALSNDTIGSPPVAALSFFSPRHRHSYQHPFLFPHQPPLFIICSLRKQPLVEWPAFEGLVPSHSNGQDWKIWLSGQTNRHGQLDINPILLRIIAPDIRTGARLLWNYLLYAQDTTPSPNPNGPPGTTISKFPLRALFTNIIGCWSIGEAVGCGAKRSVVGSLLMMKVNDNTICKAVNAEGYFSLATRRAKISESQAREMRAFGLLCMLFLFTFELAPDPVSPGLILFTIGGLKNITNIKTIQRFAPETAKKLSAWPLDHHTLLSIGNNSGGRRDPAANLIFEHLDMQVSQVRDASAAQHKEYTEHIFASEILGCPLNANDMGYFNAFHEGLNTCLMHSFPPLIRTLGESDKCAQLFESLCGRRVTNPQEVIRLLQYETVDGNFLPTNDIVITEDDQRSTKTFFTRYLSGSGHPLHDNFGLDVIGPAVRERDKDNTLMRSRRLLTMVTGSELLPSNPLQHITVQFVHQLPNNHLPVALAPGLTMDDIDQPIMYRTCSMAVMIPMCSMTRSYIAENVPDDLTTASLFDVYLHQGLWKIEESETDEFNSL